MNIGILEDVLDKFILVNGKADIFICSGCDKIVVDTVGEKSTQCVECNKTFCSYHKDIFFKYNIENAKGDPFCDKCFDKIEKSILIDKFKFLSRKSVELKSPRFLEDPENKY